VTGDFTLYFLYILAFSKKTKLYQTSQEDSLLIQNSGCHYQVNKYILRETNELLFNQIHKQKH
jgi:hypothetical protein